MNEDDIKREISRAWEWQRDEAQAMFNAILWLNQAAAGEIPHGGTQCPSPVNAAGSASNQGTMLSPVTTTPTGTTTVTEMQITPALDTGSLPTTTLETTNE